MTLLKKHCLIAALTLPLLPIACGGGGGGGNNNLPAPDAPELNLGQVHQSIEGLTLSREMSRANRNKIVDDMELFLDLDFPITATEEQELKTVMGIEKELSKPVLLDWLKERLSYIKGPQDISYNYIGITDSGTRIPFPFPEEIEPITAPAEEGVLAANIGALLSLVSRQDEVNEMIDGFNEFMISLKDDGDVNFNPNDPIRHLYFAVEFNNQTIPILNPRSGLIHLRPYLLEASDALGPNSYVGFALRMQTLFHEARHSDGNSKAESLGFIHTQCLDGVVRCDKMTNGAYAVGAMILKYLKSACLNKDQITCTNRTLQAIEILQLDSEIALPDLSEPNFLDPTPEPIPAFFTTTPQQIVE